MGKGAVAQEFVSCSDIIGRYYELIDDGHVDDVLELFDEDIIYRRGNETFNGRMEFEQFFRHDRLLKGRHVVTKKGSWDTRLGVDLLPKANVREIIVVTGNFQGVFQHNIPVDLEYADFFYFNDLNLICYRESYFLRGADVLQ